MILSNNASQSLRTAALSLRFQPQLLCFDGTFGSFWYFCIKIVTELFDLLTNCAVLVLVAPARRAPVISSFLNEKRSAITPDLAVRNQI